jgi:hypothetical protein
MAPVSRRLVLDVDSTAEPIRGSLSGETSIARPFSGWLELAHAIKQELALGASPASLHDALGDTAIATAETGGEKPR